MHTFEWKNGKLHHYVNGELRAVVPAGALDEYRKVFPDAPNDPDAPPVPAEVIEVSHE